MGRRTLKGRRGQSGTDRTLEGRRRVERQPRAVGVQVENPSRRRREGAAESRRREQGTYGRGQVHAH
jgi:hypothetical protein